MAIVGKLQAGAATRGEVPSRPAAEELPACTNPQGFQAGKELWGEQCWQHQLFCSMGGKKEKLQGGRLSLPKKLTCLCAEHHVAGQCGSKRIQRATHPL